MNFIPEEEWRPVEVANMEVSALYAAKSTHNILVVAGPGAGKTELLAQRAHFLLSTRQCIAPKRILAISFKRDAAKNLANRVKSRMPEHSSRFDSFTLDSFAKQIVDRFYLALPEGWRPKGNYLVRVASFTEKEAREWFEQVQMPDGIERPSIHTWSKKKVLKTLEKVMFGVELPYEQTTIHPLLQAWGIAWWTDRLSLEVDKPSLTFPMLNRLAAYILRCNPKIRQALQGTYSHIFLDEFQDTTSSQWDLIESAFDNSSNVLTAVGDSKQRIMVWAGADPDIFMKFTSKFSAESISLIRNYRSVPALVKIQYSLAKIVEESTPEPESAKINDDSGICTILGFDNPISEAGYLADLIATEISAGSSPRDFCILVRQTPELMTLLLQGALSQKGIKLRDESQLQDLLAEPLANITILSLRLALSARDPIAWSELHSELVHLTGKDETADGVELESIAIQHKACATVLVDEHRPINTLPLALVSILGENVYKNCYPQYSKGGYLEDVAERIGNALNASLMRTGSLQNMLSDFIGEDVVPAMSIHKSKGLEFKTVIFMGLEDEQWWNFREQPEEEKRAFFVAFSRAIGRVIFTYSKERLRWGQMANTNQRNVGALIDILIAAGVERKEIRHPSYEIPD